MDRPNVTIGLYHPSINQSKHRKSVTYLAFDVIQAYVTFIYSCEQHSLPERVINYGLGIGIVGLSLGLVGLE